MCGTYYVSIPPEALLTAGPDDLEGLFHSFSILSLLDDGVMQPCESWSENILDRVSCTVNFSPYISLPELK